MWVRIRAREELRSFLIWATVATLNFTVVLGIDMTFAVGRREPIPGFVMLLTGWIGLGLYAAVGGRRERCRPFDMTLPIAAPRIWLAHVLARATAVTLLALILTIILEFVVRRFSVVLDVGMVPRRFFVSLASAGLLAVALLEVPRPKLQRAPGGVRGALWTVLVVVAVPTVLVWLGRVGLAGAGLLALAAAVTVAVAQHRVPPAFLLHPTKPGELEEPSSVPPSGPMAPASGPTPATRGNSRLVWARTALGCLSGGAKDVMSFPMIVVIGAVLAGTVLGAVDDPDLEGMRPLYILMATYLLFITLPTRLGRLQVLDPLPISRPVMAAILVLPPFVALAVGYGAGLIGADRLGSQKELVDYRVWGRHPVPRLTVPGRLLEIAPAGAVPKTESPWGEAHQPLGRPLFRGSHSVLYSPYDAPPGSSLRFVALQISRAAEATYGVVIPPEEIASRYLRQSPEGTVLPVDDGLRLRADFDAVQSRGRGSFTLLLAISIALPVLLLMAFFFRAYRPGFSPHVRQVMVIVFAALFVVTMAGCTALMVLRVINPALVGSLMHILARELDASLVRATLAWVIGLGLLAGAYRLVQLQFERMEIPQRPTRYSLLDKEQTEA